MFTVNFVIGKRKMVSFNFQPDFVDHILSGRKKQTIRQSKRCNVGDKMHLFTGLRTRNCKRIADVICVKTDYCAIRPSGLTFGDADQWPNADQFARDDGFMDFQDMLKWFQIKYGSSCFIGHVHKWEWVS